MSRINQSEQAASVQANTHSLACPLCPNHIPSLPLQVAYTSSNGVANGGVHPEGSTHGEGTRPSSAASTQPGGKADPDMQVSRLRGRERGRGGGCTGVASGVV